MNAKIVQIMEVLLAVVTLVLGISLIIGGLGVGFFHQISGPLTSGGLGLLVGVVFLFYALRYFGVWK